MRQSRFYVNANIAVGSDLKLPKDVSHHLLSVLRKTTGQEIILFNGEGGEYIATIDSIAKKTITVSIQENCKVNKESDLIITLAQGLSRGQKMDLTLQKSVELGVQRMVPIMNQRSNVRLKSERVDTKLDHWNNVIISAAEQSGRCSIPELLPPMDLDSWLSQDESDLKLVLSPTANQSIEQISKPESSLSLLIGSEGGLNDEEITSAINSGYQAIRLGPRVFRTETAALVALSICQAKWGDLGL